RGRRCRLLLWDIRAGRGRVREITRVRTRAHIRVHPRGRIRARLKIPPRRRLIPPRKGVRGGILREEWMGKREAESNLWERSHLILRGSILRRTRGRLAGRRGITRGRSGIRPGRSAITGGHIGGADGGLRLLDRLSCWPLACWRCWWK